jgi:hypothetical protein
MLLPRLLALVCLATFCTLQSYTATTAADKDDPKKDETKEVKVAGILIDKTADALIVKVDGEDEPVKYMIPKENKKVTDSLKSVYNACRVKLTYKKDGDTRVITGASRQILKDKGTITGAVVKVHNDFWVEVKPKDGLADAFAPGGNYKDKEFMEMLRGLKPGESVTIKYVTDGERHRIESLKKNEKK